MQLPWDDLVAPFADGGVEVFYAASREGEFRQLVVGGGSNYEFDGLMKDHY